MSRSKEEILHKELAPITDEHRTLYGDLKTHFLEKANGDDVRKIEKAMDEYFTERAMELLEYMAKNEIRCFTDNEDEGAKVPMFYDVKKAQYLSAKELFENFL